MPEKVAVIGAQDSRDLRTLSVVLQPFEQCVQMVEKHTAFSHGRVLYR